MFNIDISDYYIAGVLEPEFYFSEEKNYERLNLPSMNKYVNAGVLLINLKQIRENNVTQKFIELAKINIDSQDIINIASYGKIKTLPPKYNAMITTLKENNPLLRNLFTQKEIYEAKTNPYIIHYDDQNKPYIFTYIEGALNKIHESLEKYSLIPFEHLCKTKFQDYFHDLMMKQSQLNNKYDTNNQIRNASEIEDEFKQELFKYYNNEFHKVYLCIIIKLIKENLQKILEDKFKKIIKENEKSINLKAEAALKNVTERLKEKLLKELDIYYPKEKEDIKILTNPSEINSGSFQDDFEFSL